MGRWGVTGNKHEVGSSRRKCLASGVWRWPLKPVNTAKSTRLYLRWMNSIIVALYRNVLKHSVRSLLHHLRINSWNSALCSQYIFWPANGIIELPSFWTKTPFLWNYDRYSCQVSISAFPDASEDRTIRTLDRLLTAHEEADLVSHTCNLSLGTWRETRATLQMT